MHAWSATRKKGGERQSLPLAEALGGEVMPRLVV
jgi:hypothetical protein